MRKIPDPVDDYSQVVENVKRFNEAMVIGVPLTNRLSQFRRWYWVPEANGIGPSKFIGYKNMTVEEYLCRANRDNPPDKKMNIDGRITTEALRSWFVESPTGSQAHQFVKTKVEDLALAFRKTPSSLATFHEPRKSQETTQRENPQPIPEGFISLKITVTTADGSKNVHAFPLPSTLDEFGETFNGLFALLEKAFSHTTNESIVMPNPGIFYNPSYVVSIRMDSPALTEEITKEVLQKRTMGFIKNRSR